MLTKEIIASLKSYMASMQNDVTFVVQTGEHAKRAELLEFLGGIAGVSEHLAVEERDLAGRLRGPVSFLLEIDGKDSGITFSGIPGGHEFNSLVLAILQASGTPMKLDDGIAQMVRNIEEPLHFEVFISLSCHNCPDVVQALNQFALLNDNINSEMLDGGLFQDVVEERDIQGVPSVYLNGELFANGKVDAASLVDKLKARNPDIAQTAQTAQLPLQDVTIVGGGPAGVSAAIYAARKGLAVTIIADRFGGQLKDTLGIENLVSVPYTTGTELTGALLKHLNEHEVTLKEHLRVNEIVPGDIKSVTLSSGEKIDTRTLILATGARWRELGVPGEKENVGNGVAYCPHCDGPFFKGKDVAVIGGGNSGIEAAIDLAGIVKSVTVFEFLPELKADSVLIKQAEARDNITIICNAATREIKATDGKVSAIEYEDRATGAVESLPLAGVFVQIGLLPNSQALQGVVDLTEHGEVIVDDKGSTSSPGIFAAGDVTTTPYKQIIVSMGDGATAALGAFEYLMLNPVSKEGLAA